MFSFRDHFSSYKTYANHTLILKTSDLAKILIINKKLYKWASWRWNIQFLWYKIGKIINLITIKWTLLPFLSTFLFATMLKQTSDYSMSLYILVNRLSIVIIKPKLNIPNVTCLPRRQMWDLIEKKRTRSSKCFETYITMPNSTFYPAEE